MSHIHFIHSRYLNKPKKNPPHQGLPKKRNKKVVHTTFAERKTVLYTDHMSQFCSQVDFQK